MPEELLDDLLLRWEELTDAGQDVTAEELCGDCPELADELQRRMNALRGLAWLSAAPQPEQIATHYLPLTPGSEPRPGYRLVERLGKGGFGEVWKALGPNGPVALKFIPQTEQAATVERRSLAVLEHLEHPNLLRTYQTWEADGFVVIAMELAERTLLDRCQEAQAQGSPGIPREELLAYLRDAAAGIDFLQQRYIQHRDIKPQNLLLLGGRVKVGDFGLTRLLAHSVTGHTGSLTLAYAPPEFFESKTTRQSDQYSLAVAYCQLRGGQLPFEGTPAALVAAHLHREPNLTMLPPEERPAVARALSKNPDDRWPSCRAFVEAVADPQASQQASRGKRRSWGRRKLLALGAAAAVLAVLLLQPWQGHTPTVAVRFFEPVKDGNDPVKKPEKIQEVAIRFFEPVKDAHFIRSVAVRPSELPDHPLLALSNGIRPMLWDAESGKMLCKLPYEGGGACAALAPVGLPFGLTGHEDGNIILWDLKTWKEVRRFTGHKVSVSSVDFSPEGDRILSGCCDGTVRVWDRRTGKQLHCLRGHKSLVMCVAFDHTGNYAVSGGWDGTVRFWDLEAEKERKRFPDSRTHIECVAFSSDGRTLASGGEDRTIRLWDVETRREVSRIAAHSGRISALYFLAHNRLVVADGNELRFLETPNGKDWLLCPPQPSLVQALGYTGYQGKLYVVLGTAKNGVGICTIPDSVK